MKTIKIISFLALAILFIACSRNENPDLSGRYVYSSKGEYGKADDTLIISAMNTTNKVYLIEEKTGFNRITKGKIEPREFKRSEIQAFWNGDTQILSESEFGRQYVWLSNGAGFRLNAASYHKIN